MSGKALSRSENEQLAALAALPDERIDVADIPEAPARNWRAARRGSAVPSARAAVIALDADLLAWFMDHPGDGDYQAEINRVLRRHVASTQKPSG